MYCILKRFKFLFFYKFNKCYKFNYIMYIHILFIFYFSCARRKKKNGRRRKQIGKGRKKRSRGKKKKRRD